MRGLKSNAKQWGKDLVNDVETGVKDVKRNAPQWGKDLVNDFHAGIDGLARVNGSRPRLHGKK